MNFDSSIVIENKTLSSENEPYLIAEIGLNHNKDIELTKKMIDAAATAGADAVKFQSFHTDKFINTADPESHGLVDIFSSLELDFEFHRQAQKAADDVGVTFFSTPLNIEWVELLSDLDIPVYKVASGDLINYELLTPLAQKPQPVIISTGASNEKDIHRTAGFFSFYEKPNVVFMHCISEYPTVPENVNLSMIKRINQLTGALTGFSDHTLTNDAAFGAVACGAIAIEKHFTLDKTLPGPDQSLSTDPDQFKELRERIDLAFKMRGNGDLPRTATEKEAASEYWGRRSLYHDNKSGFGYRAMRPRKKDMPVDADYYKKIFNQSR